MRTRHTAKRHPHEQEDPKAQEPDYQEPETIIVPMPAHVTETIRTWSVYEQETHQDRASYDNAVDAARFARDQAYEQARRAHHDSIQAADEQFDEASTASWKTYRSNTDTARRQRDERLDQIRTDLAAKEIHYATDLAQHQQHQQHQQEQQAQEQQAADDGGYGIMLAMESTCPRCLVVSKESDWEDKVCPACGQYISDKEMSMFEQLRTDQRRQISEAYGIQRNSDGELEFYKAAATQEHIDPETPAAPDDVRAGYVTEEAQNGESDAVAGSGAAE